MCICHHFRESPGFCSSCGKIFFALCIQTSFLVLKHVLNPDWQICTGVMTGVLPSALFCSSLIALRGGCSKSHFNWWSPMLFPPFPPEQAGRSVGLALGHAEAVRTK